MTTLLKKYKVLIIEPSPVIQAGLTAILEKTSDFQIIRCFNDIQHFDNNNKDIPEYNIILINPGLVNTYRPYEIRNILTVSDKTILIAIITNYINPQTLGSFDGTFEIYNESATIIQQLRKIAGESSPKSNRVENIELSAREKEILASVAKGLTNKEIAEKHHISIHTVISHRKNITRKTDIKTVSGLTIYAIFNNIISQQDLHLI